MSSFVHSEEIERDWKTGSFRERRQMILRMRRLCRLLEMALEGSLESKQLARRKFADLPRWVRERLVDAQDFLLFSRYATFVDTR